MLVLFLPLPAFRFISFRFVSTLVECIFLGYHVGALLKRNEEKKKKEKRNGGVEEHEESAGNDRSIRQIEDTTISIVFQQRVFSTELFLLAWKTQRQISIDRP